MSRYVPYHAEAAAKARELCKGEKDLLAKYGTVTRWVQKNVVYDYIRAVTIPKRGQYPDVERCWRTHMGICMDVASMTAGMLRAVGVNAYMCYGHADRAYHAWVEAHIGGKIYRFDHSGHARKYRREKVFS